MRGNCRPVHPARDGSGRGWPDATRKNQRIATPVRPGIIAFSATDFHESLLAIERLCWRVIRRNLQNPARMAARDSLNIESGQDLCAQPTCAPDWICDDCEQFHVFASALRQRERHDLASSLCHRKKRGRSCQPALEICGAPALVEALGVKAGKVGRVFRPDGPDANGGHGRTIGAASGSRTYIGRAGGRDPAPSLEA